MPQPLEGKVVKILDEYSVVVNLGWRDGLGDGARVVVFAAGGEEVKDPDSGESLGPLELVKAHLRVTHVQERCSVCVAESLQKGAGGDGGIQTLGAAMMAEAMGYSSEQHATEKLNVNASQITGMPQVGPISVGDKARWMQGKA